MNQLQHRAIETNGIGMKTEPGEVIAKSLPFDAETNSLLEKITLPGQDRDELYKLIGHVATRAITEFGRLTLSDLLQRQLPLAA